MKCDGMKKARAKCIITSPFVYILHIFSSYHESPNNFCSCAIAISFSSPLVLNLGGVSNAAFWINDRKIDKQKYINNIASPFSPTRWVLAAFFLKVYFAHFWKACFPRSLGVKERKKRDTKQVFALFSSNYFPMNSPLLVFVAHKGCVWWCVMRSAWVFCYAALVLCVLSVCVCVCVRTCVNVTALLLCLLRVKKSSAVFHSCSPGQWLVSLNDSAGEESGSRLSVCLKRDPSTGLYVGGRVERHS